MPSVNLVLFVAVITVVLAFQKSEKLAEAYGFAVTGTMVVTSMLAFLVARKVWGWPAWKAIPVVAFFMLFDVSFFLSCATKVLHGAWLPLVLGVLLILVMAGWRMGRTRLAARRRHEGVPLKIALSALRSPRVEHVRGTAVYLMEDKTLAPRLPAQSEADQGVPSADRLVDPDDGYAVDRGCLPGQGGDSRRGAGSGPGPIRLHGSAGRAGRREGDGDHGGPYRPPGSDYLRPCPSGRGRRGRSVDLAARSVHLPLLPHSGRAAAEYYNILHGRVVDLGSQITI